MPVVRVKGVANPMQFPDDMDIEDIKSFLQRKFANQAVAGSQSVNLTPRQPTIQASNPSLATRAAQGIGNALTSSGLISDNASAQEIGKNVTSIGEFLPGIGDATAGDEFGRALAGGDGFGMAMGALGAIPLVGDALKKLKPYQVSPTSKEWSDFDFDEINREAFGVTESDVTTLSPSELNIKWTDDLDNVEYEIKNSGKTRKQWAEGVDLSTPIDVILEDGVYKIDDGHHRYSAAKILGKDLPVSLQINDQPFVGLAKRATERGEEVHPSIMKAAVDRGYKPPTDKAMSVGGITLNDLKDVPYREQQEIAKGLQTGQPVEFYYSRNLEKAPKMTGMDFGQSIEPAGRYMNVDFTEMSGGKNWETGTIKFDNPLVLEHKNTNSTGWKKDLSDKYGGSVGKRLSNKVKKDGYDAIITVDDYGLSETISLKATK
jgi:hypothetical protein